jgi:hypothetical protein
MALREELIGRDYQGNAVERVIDLTVSEMVDLAKAGVKVELAGRVAISQAPPPVATAYDHLTDMICDRWRMSKGGREYEGFPGPTLKAVQHGDEVHVFAYSGHSEPEVLVDDAAIYPSDALLARIHLMMQHAK